MARAKLSSEAAQPDPNLRFIIGHLNVLEPLMLELSAAEVEHQKHFHRCVSGTTTPVETRIMELNAVAQEFPGEDSFKNGDQFNAPVISRPHEHTIMYDLARDAAQRATSNKTDHVRTKAGIDESSKARIRYNVY
ncbi:Putative coatomer subunit alpha [Verticillium dahliae VDG2]|nr:Putative coatomer subunit alpha [Verticillium dahliae VDG2]